MNSGAEGSRSDSLRMKHCSGERHGTSTSAPSRKLNSVDGRQRPRAARAGRRCRRWCRTFSVTSPFSMRFRPRLPPPRGRASPRRAHHRGSCRGQKMAVGQRVSFGGLRSSTIRARRSSSVFAQAGPGRLHRARRLADLRRGATSAAASRPGPVAGWTTSDRQRAPPPARPDVSAEESVIISAMFAARTSIPKRSRSRRRETVLQNGHSPPPSSWSMLTCPRRPAAPTDARPPADARSTIGRFSPHGRRSKPRSAPGSSCTAPWLGLTNAGATLLRPSSASRPDLAVQLRLRAGSGRQRRPHRRPDGWRRLPRAASPASPTAPSSPSSSSTRAGSLSPPRGRSRGHRRAAGQGRLVARAHQLHARSLRLHGPSATHLAHQAVQPASPVAASSATSRA